MAQLIAGWRKNVKGVDTVAFMQNVHAKYNKPVWIADIAFHSFSGDNINSNDIYNAAVPLVADQQEQANEYDSLLTVLTQNSGRKLVPGSQLRQLEPISAQLYGRSLLVLAVRRKHTGQIGREGPDRLVQRAKVTQLSGPVVEVRRAVLGREPRAPGRPDLRHLVHLRRRRQRVLAVDARRPHPADRQRVQGRHLRRRRSVVRQLCRQRNADQGRRRDPHVQRRQHRQLLLRADRGRRDQCLADQADHAVQPRQRAADVRLFQRVPISPR